MIELNIHSRSQKMKFLWKLFDHRIPESLEKKVASFFTLFLPSKKETAGGRSTPRKIIDGQADWSYEIGKDDG